MNVITIINELRSELDRINCLIAALEGLQVGRRRGRPPKALQALRTASTQRGSAAAQRAVEAVKKISEQPGRKRNKKKVPTK